MKKLLSVLGVLILSALLLSLASCDKEEGNDLKSNIFSDNGYIDYAEEVFLDPENPEFNEMGLFWTAWDDENDELIEIPADSAAGAALVDPSKPTIFNVHGVLLDGHLKQERFNLNKKFANPADFDLDTDFVSLPYLWLREGYNVANFHYNRFASEWNPGFIEGKIWSVDNKDPASGELIGVRYRHENGSYSSGDISNYSLAEHFAAEYIRAMNLLPDTMGDKEIRVEAHSMGGELTTAGLFLLTELSKADQLPEKQLPERYALLDSYFSYTMQQTDGSTLYIGPKDLTIRWSGKPLIDNHTGKTMLECLKNMEKDGIVLEYYTYKESLLRYGMMEIAEEFKTVSSYTILDPEYSGSDKHNAIREWYMCSLLPGTLKDVTNGTASGEIAPSAAMPTEQLKNYKGKQFKMVTGANTVLTDDDTVEVMYSVYYTINGGSNNLMNPEYYLASENDYTLRAPSKKDSVFGGWYDNPDFNGTAVTTIDTAAKKTIRLYAKWN